MRRYIIIGIIFLILGGIIGGWVVKQLNKSDYSPVNSQTNIRIPYSNKNAYKALPVASNKKLGKVSVQIGDKSVEKPIPRSKPVEVKVISEKVSISSSWVPTLTFLPMIGVVSGRRLQPRIGAQLLRSEDLELGVSLGVSLGESPTLDISLDKDLRTFLPLLQNTVIGVGYGVESGGYTRFLIHLSIFI